MKIIKLTQNQQTIVDNKYFDILNKYKWIADYNKKRKPYAARRKKIKEKYPTTYISMHRYIMYLEGYNLINKEIDHINGDTLDNRVINLRVCTHAQNMKNRPKAKNNKSGYKGVYWFESRKKWIANISYNKKTIYLGCFNNKIDAAKAYNNAALKYYKEFAKLNIIS